MKLLLFFCLAALAVAEKKSDKKTDASNGFRSEIDWVEFKNAVGIAKDLNKPIFFLIHKTWCGACKALKREISGNPKTGDLIELSKKFVMVNVEDDDEPEDSKYAPDGGYIPRIVFLDTDGEPMKTNNENKYKNNKYFYPLVVQIIDGMERALVEFEGLEKKEKKEAVEEVAEEKEETNSVEEEVVEDNKEEEVEAEAKEETKEEVKEEAKEEVKEEEKEKKEEKKEKKEEKKEKKNKKEKKESKDEL